MDLDRNWALKFWNTIHLMTMIVLTSKCLSQISVKLRKKTKAILLLLENYLDDYIISLLFLLSLLNSFKYFH